MADTGSPRRTKSPFLVARRNPANKVTASAELGFDRDAIMELDVEAIVAAPDQAPVHHITGDSRG
jgi:hypothetical protein